MRRYTYNALAADLDSYNEQLERNGSNYRLQIGSAYNRTHVNLATVEQHKRHCCQRMLESGTPRECLAAVDSFVVRELQSLLAKYTQTKQTA